MRKFVIAASALALLATCPAFAKDMYCNMSTSMAPLLDGKEFKNGGTTYKIKVKSTYSGVPESIDTKDYNKWVNVKWGTEKPSSRHTNVMARPREPDECMNGIYNEDKKMVWGGGTCNTKKHVETGKEFSLDPVDGTNSTIYRSAGAVTTTKYQNQFLSFYWAFQDGHFEQAGGCVEHK